MAEYVLHHGIMGFILFMYAIMATVTVAITISSLALMKMNFDTSCADAPGLCTNATLTDWIAVPSVQTFIIILHHDANDRL